MKTVEEHYKKWNCDSFDCHFSEGYQLAQKEFLKWLKENSGEFHDISKYDVLNKRKELKKAVEK